MDEFEVELRITQLEKTYAIATNALYRARITLRALRDEPNASATLIAHAQRRCDELVRRREALRFTLEELETQGDAAKQISESAQPPAVVGADVSLTRRPEPSTRARRS